MAWWKYGSGNLYRTQPEPAYTTEPTAVPMPSQPVHKMLRTAETKRTLYKMGGITIKNNLNELVRVSVQVGFIKRIHPF